MSSEIPGVTTSEPLGSGSSPGPVPSHVPDQSVLRFAVAMRGGVSLAVWIGGAMQEIDHLRHPDDPDDAEGSGFARHILGVTRFNRLEVDIITGASAGGLNAALAGMAIAHGTSLESLRDVWMDTADIDKLLDIPRANQATIRSLLNGDYFRREVVQALASLAERGEGGPGSPVEVFLAATVFGGVPVTEAGDPTFSDRRRQAYFHFRHLAVSPRFSDTCGRPDAPDRLGRAARASASFPVAFDPVCLEAAAFSGRIQLPAGAATPTTLRLFDGGILDNIPVARAIHAAASSPAQEPVRRWVVYLHPSPTLLEPLRDEPDSTESPQMFEVVMDLLAGRGVETLLDDLEVLREHNRESESQRVQRYSLCLAAFHRLDGDGRQCDGLASVDADHLYALLDDPATLLGWVPIGEVPPASPIDDVDETARVKMRVDFLDALLAVDETVRPFARLVRLSHLSIEWIRWVERRGGASHAELRREVYDILLVARLVDAALDRVFLATADRRVEALAEALGEARLSSALHRLAGFAGSAGPAGDQAPEPLRERLVDDSAQITLDVLAAGRLPVGPQDASLDPLDEVLLGRLADVGCALLKQSRSLADGAPTGLFGLIHRQLGAAPAVGEVRRHLVAVDAACAGLHRGRAVGAPLPIEYVRISGAAGSPLAKESQFPEGAWCKFSELREDAGRIDPEKKLSGNSLANFAAFLSPRFRANDWMWGRMDAAAGLVEILIRPEHLTLDRTEEAEAVEARVEAAVLAPFASVGNENDPLRESAETVFRRLWVENSTLVHDDVRLAVNDPAATMDVTRRLLIARWQLEIFLAEVRRLLASPLHPGSGPEQFPAVDPPGEADRPGGGEPSSDELQRATANIAKVMSAYEGTPRRALDLWGARRTTALGVRVARNLSRSLVPGGGAARWAARSLAAVPIMITTAALLARGAFLVACSLLLNVVLVPRLERGSLFQWVVLVLSTLGSLLFWLVLVRRRTGEKHAWRGWVALVVTVAIQAFGWTVMRWSLLSDWLVPPERVPLRTPFVRDLILGKPFRGALVVAAATFLAWYLLLVWAKKRWAVPEAAAIGVIWGWWMIVGAWEPVGRLGFFARLQAALGSMWIPALLLVFLSAALTVMVRIEDRGGADSTD